MFVVHLQMLLKTVNLWASLSVIKRCFSIIVLRAWCVYCCMVLSMSLFISFIHNFSFSNYYCFFDERKSCVSIFFFQVSFHSIKVILFSSFLFLVFSSLFFIRHYLHYNIFITVRAQYSYKKVVCIVNMLEKWNKIFI